MAKAAKSTPPPSAAVEPRGHLRAGAPEFTQPMLGLKVNTNRDRQPQRATVPTTTMTNTIPRSRGTCASPCHAPGSATPSRQMSHLLMGTQAFRSLTHVYIYKHMTERVEEFICLGLRRWFSGTNAEKNKTEQRSSRFKCKFAEADEPLCWRKAGADAGVGHHALGGCSNTSVPSPHGCSLPPGPESWSQMPFSSQQNAGKKMNLLF